MSPYDRAKLIVQVLGALVGFVIIINDIILTPPFEPATSGFGLILTGLGPTAVKDYVLKKREEG